MTTSITLDHPGWLTAPETNRPVRVVIHQGTAWFADCRPDGLVLLPVASDSSSAPPLAPYSYGRNLPDAPDAAPLVEALGKLGTVQRVANPSLWDAITTAILRQVVRAEQARKVYRRWCAAYGPLYETPVGPMSAAPDPETVLSLSDEAFAEVGTKFHRTALQAAAHAYLKAHDTWTGLPAEELVKALDDIPRVGPWTASAAAADYTGDFSVYPHGDLAVRTWAGKAAPDLPLPVGDRAFEQQWRHFTGNHRTQLHTLTLFTLTWGSHVRTDQHHPEADRQS